MPFTQPQRNALPQTCHLAHHVRPSACARENKKRSRAALGIVAASACNARERARSKSAAAARPSPPASRCLRLQCRAASAAHRASWRAPPAPRQHFTSSKRCANAAARAHLDHGLIRAARLHERNRRCETASVAAGTEEKQKTGECAARPLPRLCAQTSCRSTPAEGDAARQRLATQPRCQLMHAMLWGGAPPWRARSQPPSLPRSTPPARRT